MKPIVLIAEDEPLLRQLIALEVMENGMEVMEAADGEEVMDILRAHQPDLILLDLLMPRFDGYEVLRALRQERSDIPVVVLSNLDSPPDQKLTAELGARGFFVKSNFESSELLGLLRQYLPSTVG